MSKEEEELQVREQWAVQVNTVPWRSKDINSMLGDIDYLRDKLKDCQGSHTVQQINGTIQTGFVNQLCKEYYDQDWLAEQRSSAIHSLKPLIMVNPKKMVKWLTYSQWAKAIGMHS